MEQSLSPNNSKSISKINLEKYEILKRYKPAIFRLKREETVQKFKSQQTQRKLRIEAPRPDINIQRKIKQLSD